MSDVDGHVPVWEVASPLGVRTRICYIDPTGAHFLTPRIIRDRYRDSIKNSALVFWHLPELNLCGFRAGIDEITWTPADVLLYETSFCRPAKAGGYITLEATNKDQKATALIATDCYDENIMVSHRSIADILETHFPSKTKVCDYGYDA